MLGVKRNRFAYRLLSPSRLLKKSGVLSLFSRLGFGFLHLLESTFLLYFKGRSLNSEILCPIFFSFLNRSRWVRQSNCSYSSLIFQTRVDFYPFYMFRLVFHDHSQVYLNSILLMSSFELWNFI